MAPPSASPKGDSAVAISPGMDTHCNSVSDILLVCSGRRNKLTKILMCCSPQAAGGTTIGIIPGDSAAGVSPAVDILIITGMGRCAVWAGHGLKRRILGGFAFLVLRLRTNFETDSHSPSFQFMQL